MKPATPLPWFDCRMNWVRQEDGEPNSPESNMKSDGDFACHAANAYPKLVALAKHVAALSVGDNPPYQTAEALLHELGEAPL